MIKTALLSPTEKKERQHKILFILSIFFLFSILAYLFPHNTDDWRYLFREDLSFSVLKNHIVTTYTDLNGRVIGNLLGFIFIRLRPLSAIIVSGTMTLSGVLIGKLANVKSIYGYSLIYIILFLVPFGVFNQAFVWSSGFYNYALPVLLLLAFFYLIRDFFVGKRLKNTLSNIVLSIILGLTVGLFVESLTAYVLICAIILWLWYIVRYKKVSAVFSAYLVSVIGSTIIMLSSPALNKVTTGSDWYRGIPRDLQSFSNIFLPNFRDVTGYYLLYNYLILFLISLCLFYLVFKMKQDNSEAKNERKGMLVQLIGSTALLIFLLVFLNIKLSQTYPVAYIIIAIIVYVFWGITLISIIRKTVQETYTRQTVLFFFASSILSVLPLLIVKPIGPRCFWITNVFLTLIILSLSSYIFRTYPLKMYKGFKITMMVIPYIILSVFFFVYGTNHVIENQKIAHVENAVIQQKTKIELPHHKYRSFLHYSNSPEWGEYYYINKPYDIKATYIAYDQWKEKYLPESNNQKASIPIESTN